MSSPAPPGNTPSAWPHVVQAAASLGAGMGVGRFVYTPILPLMVAQSGLSPAAGASIATANYVGNLIGAMLGTAVPPFSRSVLVHRVSLVVMVLSLAAMPFTHSVPIWLVLRLVSGVASGAIFVYAVSALLHRLRDRHAHLSGWGFSGVGVAIALSGALVLVLQHTADWRAAWWSAAALCAVLGAVAWPLRPEAMPEPAAAAPTTRPTSHRWFGALFVGYTLEGVGYIIAGTFLVAAITQNSAGWLGSASWVLVGLAAVPSSVVWARLAKRWSRPGLLLVALLVQAVGIVLPALWNGTPAALIAAVLFGATFVGISNLAVAIGTHLRFPRAVALLTVGYSGGQVLGPLVVTPLLHHGYHQALVLGAVVVLAAALAVTVLRVRFPHDLPTGTGFATHPGARPSRLGGIRP